MIATSLKLEGFRNYGRYELTPHPALTVLVGPNAAGKTNLIEALQLMTAASSFRHPRWEDLVGWGTAGATVIMEACEGQRRLDISLEVDADGAHSFRVNGQTKRRASEVTGRFPSVVFTPDDLSLVKGPAERRRAAIDDLGSQLSPAYASLRRDFGRVVRQRNTLLKEDPHNRELSVWDEQLASLGARFVTHRLRLLSRVMDEAARHYTAMAPGESLAWHYEDHCGLHSEAQGPLPEQDLVEGCIHAELVRRAGEERRRAVTLVGPHRDDIVFTLDGRDTRSFASQGQQRTAALAWKLAEVDVIEDVARSRPMLLLDDVMSELDADRRAALSRTVIGRTQTFITTTNLGYFDAAMLADATIVEL
ncbi:MAG: DNA replication/repair protein RecF [Coriobacteriia bacterium]|nr:DNA replication/repair protein RecF [Coriobacteriia bacterium]